jgi:rod shape-determining protein MreD
MRRPLTLVALGLVALLLQGGIATHVPRAYVPDLAFLIVVTCGLHLPGARGLLVVAWLGYTADLLSGAPLGEHALLWVGLWGLTGVVNRRLDLRRVPPLMVAAAAFTLAETAAFVLLHGAVVGRSTIDSPRSAPRLGRDRERAGADGAGGRRTAYGAARYAAAGGLRSSA